MSKTGKSVLLIDDDAIANHVNNLVLKKIQFFEDIKIFKNGIEAINYLSACAIDELPDIIFLDINMPVMNGFEFLNVLKNLSLDEAADIKVFMLTTSKDSRDFQKASTHDISGYFIKPLTEEKVKLALKSIFLMK